jgi:hypothetical protein
MNRIERAIASSPIINGRMWRVDRTDRQQVAVSEVVSGSFWPGRWRGQPELGFGLLESAAAWRQVAPLVGAEVRQVCVRRARQFIEQARERRVGNHA